MSDINKDIYRYIDLIVDGGELASVPCVEINNTVFVNCTRDTLYFPGNKVSGAVKMRPSGIFSDITYKRIVTNNDPKFPFLKIRVISSTVNIPKFKNDNTFFIVPYIVAVKEKRNDMLYPGGDIKIMDGMIVYTTLEQVWYK